MLIIVWPSTDDLPEPQSVNGTRTPEAISSPQLASTITSLQIDVQSNSHAAIDPISRVQAHIFPTIIQKLTRSYKQILQRTKLPQSSARILPHTSTDTTLGSSQEPHAASPLQQVAGPAALSRDGSAGSANKGSKDKK